MVFNFRIRSFVYYFSIIVLVILVASCESNNYKFYVPKIPFKSGFEELGDPKQANLKYNFELFKYEYVINLSIDNNKYNKAVSLPKTVLVKEGEQLSSKKFYNLFLHDKKDEATLKNILNQINKRSNGKEFDVVQVIVTISGSSSIFIPPANFFGISPIGL